METLYKHKQIVIEESKIGNILITVNFRTASYTQKELKEIVQYLVCYFNNKGVAKLRLIDDEVKGIE